MRIFINDFYPYDDAEETRFQMTHVPPDNRSTQQIHEDNVSLAHDQRETERVNRCFNYNIQGYKAMWLKDDTPPEKRNRLFYALRLAGFFQTFARIAERSPAVPESEYKRLLHMQIFYEELAAKLQGEKPYQHYRHRLICKHGCPDRAVLPEEFTDWFGNEAVNMKWTYWPD